MARFGIESSRLYP